MLHFIHGGKIWPPKKEDISITYFPKTGYWTPLVTNVESVDKKTNPYFKNICALSVA